MPLPPPPTYYTAEIIMRGVSASQGSTSHNAEFVFHFARAATATLPWSATAIETAFQANIAVPIAAALNVRYTQSYNSVRCLDDALNAATIVPRAVVGSIAGDSLPQHVTAFMLLKSAYRGKSYRGNKKFFPLSESDSTLGSADLLNAAALARWATVQTAILAGFTPAGMEPFLPYVFSRANSQVKVNPTTVQVVPLVTAVTNQRMGRMSKREAASVY